MDSDLFITFVLHHRGKFLRDEDGELMYDNEEIDVREDVNPDKCCPWQFDYEAHIYFEHQVDVPVFSKTAQAKESLGSIEVGRKTYDAGEGEGDVHMEDIQHAAHVEGDVHMGDIQHVAHVEDDMNEDEFEASGSNNMPSSDDYESAEDSVYRPSPPLAEKSDDGSSENNEGRDDRSGEETMEANPTLKRSQNFRAQVAASKKKKEIPNEEHADSEEEERHACAAMANKNVKAEDYVHPWLTMDCYRATYEFYTQPILGKDLWQKVDYIGPVPPPIKKKTRKNKKE
ncbi:hypothetical protein SESBI_42249 [Sesbania bispinosa]|nr:hypothetical protein SESBI_42249 [Sesbania bispinosa]